MVSVVRVEGTGSEQHRAQATPPDLGSSVTERHCSGAALVSAAEVLLVVEISETVVDVDAVVVSVTMVDAAVTPS